MLEVWESRTEDTPRAGKVSSLCSLEKGSTSFSFLFLFFVGQWYNKFPLYNKRISILNVFQSIHRVDLVLHFKFVIINNISLVVYYCQGATRPVQMPCCSRPVGGITGRPGCQLLKP